MQKTALVLIVSLLLAFPIQANAQCNVCSQNKANRQEQKEENRQHKEQQKKENQDFRASLEGKTPDEKKKLIAEHRKIQHDENRAFHQQQKNEKITRRKEIKSETTSGSSDNATAASSTQTK